MKKIYEQPKAQIVTFESERIMDETGVGGNQMSIGESIDDDF